MNAEQLDRFARQFPTFDVVVLHDFFSSQFL
jgi:hypothetical protein